MRGWLVATVLLVLAVGSVPHVAAGQSSDSWADTCVGAKTVSTGSYSGIITQQEERDVLALNVNSGETATISVEFGDELDLFAVNKYIMHRDEENETSHFERDDTHFPNLFYPHYGDVSFSIDADPARSEYQERDSGKELIARHLVDAYRLTDDTTRFRLRSRTDRPICLVLRKVDNDNTGGWTLSYSKDGGDGGGDLPATVEAKNERIDELVSELEAREERINTLERRVETLESRPDDRSTRTVVRTVVRVENATPITRTVVRTQVRTVWATRTPGQHGFSFAAVIAGIITLLILSRR